MECDGKKDSDKSMYINYFDCTVYCSDNFIRINN